MSLSFTRRGFLQQTLGAALQRGAAQPNIVLMMADDLGYECLSCYGSSSYRTPNLDRLAGAGVRFTHAYAQPLCTPTRIQLLTGKSNFRNWQAFGVMDPKRRRPAITFRNGVIELALPGSGSSGATILPISNRSGEAKGCCRTSPDSTTTVCGTPGTPKTKGHAMEIRLSW